MKRTQHDEKMSCGPPHKKISLSLTADYAKTWGCWEGLRELVQNWHDGLYDTKTLIEERDEGRPFDQKITTEDYDILHKKVREDEEYDMYESTLTFYKMTEKTDANIPVRDPVSVHKVGYVVYEKGNGRLAVINKQISLQKRVLLLGYSTKTSKYMEVIGQFGEGLKVGALALLRSGRIVTMETAKEHWRFELNMDQDFGLKVLTVHVTDRSRKEEMEMSCPVCKLPEYIIKDLTEHDTVTCVTIERELWLDKYEQRFLFLRPSEYPVPTQLGYLLLDKELEGQLYVKKVWVADYKDDDLATGVDFIDLCIDRDRNAVPRPNEIDHLMSSMWIDALKRDKDDELSGRYYGLLKNDKFRDVRQAMIFADPAVAGLVKKRFKGEHGDDVIPISNKLTSTDIENYKSKIDTTLVCVNDTLLKLLHLSGMKSVEEEIKAREKAPYEFVPKQKLTKDEQDVFHHAFKLAKQSVPHMQSGKIDFIEYRTPSHQGCIRVDKEYLVPIWMLKMEKAHMNMKSCPSENLNKCVCRETRLALALINIHNTTLQYMSGTNQYENVLLNVLRPIIAQGCIEYVTECKSYCHPIHHPPPATSPEAMSVDSPTDIHQSQTDSAPQPPADIPILPGNHEECNHKEKELRDKMYAQKKSYDEEVVRLRKKVEDHTTKLVQTQKELTAGKIGYSENEQKLREQFDIKFKEAQLSWREKYYLLREKADQFEDKYNSLRQEMCSVQAKHEILAKEHAGKCEAIERKQNFMLDELLHYIHIYVRRTSKLVSHCEGELNRQDLEQCERKTLEGLRNFANVVLEDLRNDDHFRCVVCSVRRKNTIVFPCGHYKCCDVCIKELEKKKDLCDCSGQEEEKHIRCPFCRKCIEQKWAVFD